MITRLRKAMYAQLIPLVVGFIVLAALVVGRSILIERVRVDHEASATALTFERRIVGLLSLVQDAETGQRGYLLTSERAYLEPYEAAVRSIPIGFDGLREMVVGNDRRKSQIEALHSMVQTKLEELDQTLQAYNSGDVEGALALVREDIGKAEMDRIRGIVADVRRDENALLTARVQATERADTMLRFVASVLLALVLAIGVWGFIAARRLTREAIDAHAGMAQSNEALRREIVVREAAESQIRQMQKMEAVGQLTGGIAHDFNNMLAVILSAMNLAQRRLAKGDTDIGKFIEAAADAASRAANLTARLLAFARQQPLTPQVIDANHLITSMTDLLRRTLGPSVDIETVLADGLWRIRADTSQLENAILNLAVNSRDAMPDGGRLAIETENVDVDPGSTELGPDVPAGHYVRITVSDTGTGMPQEVLAKAFDPFFTTKSAGRGTGLGLSQVFGFVRQSGGHVRIVSEEGKGTMVDIYMPRWLGEARGDQAPREPDLHKAPVEPILVVEDDERVRAGTVAALRELGYPVIHAADANEALHKLDGHPEIALMFTDIVMPGVDGRKLADTARRKFPSLKVLFTTGLTRDGVISDGVLDADIELLPKPFTIDQLASKIRSVLDRQSS